MFILKPTFHVVALAAIALLLSSGIRASSDVLTNNYDNSRTGANLDETLLNVTNVTPETFGRVFHYAVDGPVFAQPLVVSGLDIPDRGRSDVVYVATASNSVYAFVADGGEKAQLWHRQLVALPGGIRAAASGILSTPVIDRNRGIIYVVAGLMDGSDGKFVLHALDLADGSGKDASPVLIRGSVDVDGSSISFQPTNTRVAVQRAALAIAQDKLIVAFGGDYFEGWVFAFSLTDLQVPPAAFCTTCVSRHIAVSRVDYLDASCILLGPGGGIWQSGRAPVVDPNGKVYFFTGNKQHVIKAGCMIPPSNNACSACTTEGGCVCKGSRFAGVCRGPDVCNANETENHELFDANESLIQLDPGQGLKLTAWFRPANWNITGPEGLEINDLDLGGSGPLLIPGTTRLVGGGKQGVMYVLDVAAPAKPCKPTLTETCTSPNPVQSFQVAPSPARPNQYYRHILGGPVLWTRPADRGGPLAYVWRENDHLRGYRISGQFEGCNTEDPALTTSHHCPSLAQSEDFIDHHPGGILALSANGADGATAVLWASTTRAIGGPGKLMAFKAVPDSGAPAVLTKIWDSDICVEDRLDVGSDFVPPTVANGKVYVATGANRVDVFGLMDAKKCLHEPLPASFGPMMQ